MTRVRSTVFENVTLGPYTQRGYDRLGNQTYVATASGSRDDTKTISDQTTADYYGRLSRSEFLPINPVTISRVKNELIQPSSGTCTYTPVPTSGTATCTIIGDFMWDGSPAYFADYTPAQSDLDYAVIQALAKAKEPDWDVLTFIGEFPQTVELLGAQVRRYNWICDKIAKRARRRELRFSKRRKRHFDPRRALDEFFNLWLEARYGWRPLLYDIDSIAKAVNHKHNGMIARKSYIHTVDLSDNLTTDTVRSPDLGNFRRTKTRSGTCKIRAVVYHRSEMSRFGANPVLTAWELTRFSFVFDWLINVGAWIQAISPRIGYNQLGVSLSWHQSTVDECTTTLLSGTAPSRWNYSLTPQKFRLTAEKYVRNEYTGVPLPSIQLNLNKLKVVDIVALVLQGRDRVMSRLRL